MQGSMLDEVAGILEQGVEQARERGATAAKIHFHRWERTGCSFENARLKEIEAAQGLAYDVSVVADGRKVNVTGNNLADLSEMVTRATTLVSIGSAAHFEGYPGAAKTAEVQTYSERTAALSRERMIETCQGMVDTLKAYSADLFIGAGANRYESEEYLVTSGGVRHRARHTGWGLGAGVQRTEGTDMLFANYGRGWKDLNEYWDPGWITARILSDLRNGETLAEPPTGKTTVYLPPEAFQRMLMPVVMAVNGRNVAKGDSPLRGRLGERVLDPGITLVDNPHLDFGLGANEMDGDGVPTRVMTLFRDGVLESFLYDLDTAGMAGVEPTGNNGCSPYFLEALPGTEQSDALLAGIADGLYVRSLIGFGQSNLMNGDVAGNVALGFRIKNGKLVGRVKNTMIAGNVYDVLKENVRLSADRDPVNRMPHAVVEGISVSSV